MFVVMTAGASEAEILGVKSRILAEGLTPFDHVGAERTVIAVVGEIGARRPVLIERFSLLPGVASVTPISKPFKLTSREFHPEDTVIRAQVPMSEMLTYGAQLRSITQGRGTFHMEFSHYSEVPQAAQEKIIAQSKAGKAAAEGA